MKAAERYLYRCTTDKMLMHIERIEEAGDTIEWPCFLGGRDWVLVCRKADPGRIVVDWESLGVKHDVQARILAEMGERTALALYEAIDRLPDAVKRGVQDGKR